MKRLFPLLLGSILAGSSAVAQSTCATAVPITPATYYASGVNGAQAPTPLCVGSIAANHGRWYRYTATQDTLITVSTDLPENAGGDTRVHVYKGSCDQLVCIGGDDDSGSGYLSITTFPVQQGQDYYIAFDDYWRSDAFTFILEYAQALPNQLFFSQQYFETNSYPYCVVDMNNDGLDDLVSVSSTSIVIHYQQADGGFERVAHTTTSADYLPSWSICAGDLDGNGFNDLVYAGSGITIMMANDDGSGYTEVSQPHYIFCQRSNVVDINNDGLLDVFSCHDTAPNVYYINNGDGTWQWNQGGLGDQPDGGNYGSVWIDYDNDGDLDLYIAKCRGVGAPASIDELWRNNGDGTFTNVAAQMGMADQQQTWSAAWADFDNDGDLDVLIGASSFSGGGHKLLRNDGGSFTNVTEGSGFDTFTGTSIEFIARDFDNDGYMDVLGGGGLMMNNGDMTFTQVNVPFTNGPTGDLNNNGFIDVQNNNVVFFNSGNNNHWIKVLTKGTVSNPNGIGARVEIETPSGIQIRDIVSGDGYRYMSSLTAHFGIGSDTEVNSITVRWPSGIVNVVEDPGIDTTIVVREDDTQDVATHVAGAAQAQLGLFPSPTRDVLYVSAPWSLAGCELTISDATGKVIERATSTHGTLGVSHLPPGLYLLRVEGPRGTLTGRFMKEE